MHSTLTKIKAGMVEATTRIRRELESGFHGLQEKAKLADARRNEELLNILVSTNSYSILYYPSIIIFG